MPGMLLFLLFLFGHPIKTKLAAAIVKNEYKEYVVFIGLPPT